MTADEALIRGHVAKIVNVRQLVINIGSDDGVIVDMMFDVVEPTTQEVRDPLSGEVLGNLDLPKKRVRVTRVMDRMSVASTLSKRVNKGGQGGLSLSGVLDNIRNSTLDQIYQEPHWVTVYETLKKSDSSYEPLHEDESAVRVGDPVVEVREKKTGETGSAEARPRQERAAQGSN